MHLGFEGYSGLLLYILMICGFCGSIFWKPIAGFYLLVPLLPLQTFRYRLNEFPLGSSFVGIMLLGVVIGLLRRRQTLLRPTPWTVFLIIYGAYTLFTLITGSFYLRGELPLPGNPRFGNWVEYMFMPGMLLLVAAVEPTRKEIRIILLLMCLATFGLNKNYWDVVSSRDYSSYSADLRDAGTIGYAGTNGLAAYEAQFTVLLLALAAYESKRLIRLGCYTLAGLSAMCLMYSLSRGGYVALAVGILFIGFAKQRTLLVLLVAFGLTWSSIVPAAVSQRVFMTYDQESGGLDHSAQTRIALWEDAMHLFASSPAVGTGFNTYAYMHRVGTYEDTHNYYLKVLVETGVAGLLLFVVFLGLTLYQGVRTWFTARDPLAAALGLGLAAWTISSAVANAFGDRWSFMQVNAYLWILAGLVASSHRLERERRQLLKSARSKRAKKSLKLFEQETLPLEVAPVA